MADIIGLEKTPVKVNVQVKLSPQVKGNNLSKSLTVCGMSVNEVFNRIKFTLERISNVADEVQITHYRRKNNGKNNER